ncbi:oxidoreductase [Myriangium duriaei CBS 260.36]|uniref:Oxidoreductase n=1 Tax=Myriangium duriaei CBS 260.36 TaxID=1168546 RepID=A0A9P4J954_9PEZI|nr:oxidoreductase [Myriangium duriaei CBS 260.36]
MSNEHAEHINIALVGAGAIGPLHVKSILKNPRTRLACIVDPSPAAELVAKGYAVPLFTSVAALASSSIASLVSAAVICTPNSTHVPLTDEIASIIKVPILVEKPLCSTPSEGRALLEAAPPILVGHHRRFNSYVVATKRLLDGGILGRPVAVSGLWTTQKPAAYFTTTWRTSRAASGGPVAINLIHEVDCLQYLLGPIVRVTAEKTVTTRPPNVDPRDAVEEGCAILLRFASGVVGTFVLSDAVASPHNFEAGTGESPIVPFCGRDFWRFFGTSASLSVPEMRVSRFAPAPGVDNGWACPIGDEAVPVDVEVPFDLQMDHFADVVVGKEKPRCTVQDALLAVAVCDAVVRSMDTGLPVDVESIL